MPAQLQGSPAGLSSRLHAQPVAHEQLAAGRMALHARADVDGVPEGREIDDGAADVADVCEACVDGDADVDPRSICGAVADRAQEIASGLDGARAVLRAADAF